MLLKVNTTALQRQREQAQMTPYRLAVKAGLPVNAIYRLEDGTTKMTNHLRAREIAKALHCNIEAIFSGTKGA
ncbi:MAG: helix-turn-helix transcriptional regulator [Oscillospiraceae bacterium]|nr:helix-turn-helix transcriptional regulator [Oscillospiraceae bacterium]